MIQLSQLSRESKVALRGVVARLRDAGLFEDEIAASLAVRRSSVRRMLAETRPVWPPVVTKMREVRHG